MNDDSPKITAAEYAIADAKELRATQSMIVRRTLLVSWIFRVALYGMGAALAASLFGVHLPGILLGFFGILILLVMFLDQQFRPDVKFINAKTRVLQLTRAISTAQENLTAVRAGDRDAPDAETITAEIVTVIDAVQRAQHLDYALIRQRVVSTMGHAFSSKT